MTRVHQFVSLNPVTGCQKVDFSHLLAVKLVGIEVCKLNENQMKNMGSRMAHAEKHFPRMK